MESLIMEPLQLSIWPESEWGPKLKSKKEIFNKKLLERAVLSEEELEKYNFPLRKEDLVDYSNKHNCTSRLGIPQMLLTTLTQYLNKEQKDLLVYDLLILSNSIKNVFPEGAYYTYLRKFRKENELSFFGNSQYSFMEKYLESLD